MKKGGTPAAAANGRSTPGSSKRGPGRPPKKVQTPLFASLKYFLLAHCMSGAAACNQPSTCGTYVSAVLSLHASFLSSLYLQALPHDELYMSGSQHASNWLCWTYCVRLRHALTHCVLQQGSTLSNASTGTGSKGASPMDLS